jgi:hypothetical protein
VVAAAGGVAAAGAEAAGGAGGAAVSFGAVGKTKLRLLRPLAPMRSLAAHIHTASSRLSTVRHNEPQSASGSDSRHTKLE